MATQEQKQKGAEKLDSWPSHKGAHLSSVRGVCAVVGLFSLPLVVFSVIQYFRYGFGLFLGWDTSTYVWWAELFRQGGANYLLQISYPNLYVVILTEFGQLVGGASLAERVLPFLVALPLGWACYRLTFDITSDRTLGYLGALLGGLAINTLRLESDLHRNLLSFAVSMLLGALVSSQLGIQPFSWRARWKHILLVWLPLLAVVAYTQMETYAVISIALLLMFLRRRDAKGAIMTLGAVSLPILVALPLLLTFFSNYAESISLIGLAPQPPISILTSAFLYLGGLALPWSVVGLLVIFRRARNGTQAALFIESWLLALLALFPIAELLGLPYDRFLYVVPIPIILASGARAILQVRPALSARNWARRPLPRIRVRYFGKNSFRFALALLLITVVITSTTADSFLRPYVSQQDINRLDQTAALLHQLGYQDPILVMYGATAADVNSIYRAYFGIDMPDNLAYYGKLQFLFSLPNPAEVYTWQYDPSFELASSTRYRTEILTQLGSASAITSHPIVIAGGDTYSRPLSEVFLQQFETSPGSGIYIIPPNQLGANQTDNWRLYAYSDWTNKTSAYVANATWAGAQKALTYVQKGPTARFDANYTISLVQSWPQMQLSIRLYDWQSPFVFPDSSNATLAPLQISFDNKALMNYTYTSTNGPLTIASPLSNVASGVHTITVSARSTSSAVAVAVALDTIQVCPGQCV